MKKIYELSASYEEDRPVIEFDDPNNTRNDWDLCAEVMAGHRPFSDYPRDVEVIVHSRDATHWHCYSLPGTLGLFSKPALDSIGAAALGMMTTTPATLNGTEYMILHCVKFLDCLDRSLSKYETFRSNPQKIRKVLHYKFYDILINDDICFCLPKSPLRLLATESVRDRLCSAGLKGLDFSLLP